MSLKVWILLAYFPPLSNFCKNGAICSFLSFFSTLYFFISASLIIFLNHLYSLCSYFYFSDFLLPFSSVLITFFLSLFAPALSLSLSFFHFYFHSLSMSMNSYGTAVQLSLLFLLKQIVLRPVTHYVFFRVFGFSHQFSLLTLVA